MLGLHPQMRQMDENYPIPQSRGGVLKGRRWDSCGHLRVTKGMNGGAVRSSYSVQVIWLGTRLMAVVLSEREVAAAWCWWRFCTPGSIWGCLRHVLLSHLLGRHASSIWGVKPRDVATHTVRHRTTPPKKNYSNSPAQNVTRDEVEQCWS